MDLKLDKEVSKDNESMVRSVGGGPAGGERLLGVGVSWREGGSQEVRC